jgi:two-component system, NarL family, response regulator DevR
MNDQNPSPAAPVRVFIIEDHNVIVTGLRSYFRPSRDPVEVAVHATDLPAAMDVDPASFDIILLDLWLPQGDPLDNFRLLAKRFPGKPIVIYTAERSLHWQRNMFKAGAKGFLGKDARKAEIQSVLMRAVKGETVYSEMMTAYETRSVIEGFRDEKFGLSAEQQAILHLFIEGQSTKAIAAKLGRDRSTIDRSLRHIRKIFGVQTDVELVKILLRMDSDFPAESR